MPLDAQNIDSSTAPAAIPASLGWPQGTFTAKSFLEIAKISYPSAVKKINKGLKDNQLKKVGKASAVGKGNKATLYSVV